MAVLKIAKVSTLTAPCEIIDGFTVLVRHLTPAQTDHYWSQSSKPGRDPVTGERKMMLDPKLAARNGVDMFVDLSGCSGLTPSRIRLLGLELEEDPPTNAAGEVDCTAEVLQELWLSLPFDRFAGPIIRTSQNLVAALEAAKKNALMD